MLFTKSRPYAGNGENLFDDERAGNDISEHRSEVRYNGDKRVFERVSKNYRLLDTPFALAVRI